MGGDDNVLKLDHGDGFTALNLLKTIELRILNRLILHVNNAQCCRVKLGFLEQCHQAVLKVSFMAVHGGSRL